MWPLALALLLCWPLLVRGGYPLARDLVFVPHEPLRADLLGFTGAAPRAVPLDVVVATLNVALDGAVLVRAALPLLLAAAGWGAARALAPLGVVPMLVAGGLAVWNPFVVERLALGQWALLSAWASLPWLVMAASRVRDRARAGAGPGRRTTLTLLGWLALASLTPSGGVLAVVVVGVLVTTRRLRTWWPVAVGLALQLPWVLAGLLGGATVTSDPAGVAVFAARGEGPGGALVALLGLGGIWHLPSVPATRGSWWSVAAASIAVLAVVLAVLSRRTLRVTLGPCGPRRLVALGLVSLLLALLPTLPGGGSALEWALAHLPGTGLLRDSQKLLMPWGVLVVLSTGAAAALAVEQVRRRVPGLITALALLVVPLPLVLLPDAVPTASPTLDPVEYPAGYAIVSDLLDQAHAQGDDRALATLPWRSYRLFTWGSGLVSSDPATRWFDRSVLTSDELMVGATTLRGESLAGRDLGRDLAVEPVVEALRSAGAGWALVYLDDPMTVSLDLGGLVEVYRDDQMALYRVPGV